jgi:hypothetical protein
LQEWGVPVLDNLTTRTGVHIHRWYYGDAPAEKPTFNENAAIIRWMMEKAAPYRISKKHLNSVPVISDIFGNTEVI